MQTLHRSFSFALLEIVLILNCMASSHGQNGPVTGGNELKSDKALITTKPILQALEPVAIANRIELFNGKDFSGWAFCMKDATPSNVTWSVTNGVIHCSGKAVGYLRTESVFHDYKLTVEWRFVKMAPKADNTGVLVHIQQPDKIWPVCIQVQGKHGKQGDLFLMAGAESKEHKGLDANTPIPMRGDSNEKAIGEWNTSETVCSGSSVKAYINGKLMNETTDCSVSQGAIGIQSEGAEFEIRRMLVESLSAP